MPQSLETVDIETAATGEGISVSYVPEDQLSAIIGEAQEEFRKRFG